MATDTKLQLLQLCRGGNLPSLKDLITKQGLNPNEVKDPSGLTLLHLACQHGYLDIVQYLIKWQNCNPETTIRNGCTPLHIACKSGHLHIAKCLITDHKCNPHCTDNDDYTPLHAASESGNIETVKYLITEQGCDPQVGDSIGNTPLHYASECGCLDIVQCLITNFNCNPQKSNKRGSISLHFACKGGKTAVARYLIDEHHCDPNSTNRLGNTSVHLACLSGCLPLVKYFIDEHGCNPQIANHDGLTPLHYACLNGHLDITKYLISDRHCNPQCSTKNGTTPLHHACQEGYLEVAKFLIAEHKCSPEHGNVNGYTPLHSAANSGHLTVVKYIIDELGFNAQITTNNGNTPLHYACLNGHLDITKYLILGCICNPQYSTKNGLTPLHCACQEGHLEVAKFLIAEHKCSPEHGNVDGYTPLHSATNSGHLAVVKYLINELGCGPQIADNDGCTPLHYACLNGHLDITKYLILDCVCNPQYSTKNGLTPLHHACQNGHLEVAKFLIAEHKCSPEHGNVDGYTPLHLAASNGNLTLVKYIIDELGFNAQITTNNGDTPLHYACLNGHLDVTKNLILDSICNPQYSTKDGLTPLHCACQNGHLEVVKYLITEHKCSPEHGNVDGYTLLHSAASNGHLAVVKYLIKKHNCNPQCSDISAVTPLHVACGSGHLHVVKYFLEEQNCQHEPQAKLNPVTMAETLNLPLHFRSNLKTFQPFPLMIDGFTPLNFASMEGQLDIVKYLIDICKCNPNHSTSNGLTAIDFAQMGGHQEIVAYLRNKHQCSLSLDRVFHGALSQGLFNQFGVKCDSLVSNVDFNDMSFSPLQQACWIGDLTAVKFYTTKSKYNPSVGFLGFTPLHTACMMGHLTIAKYLISDLGCDPQLADNEGLTPLHYACLNGHLDVAKYLISDCNCDQQCTNKFGNTPLHCACKNGCHDVAKYHITEHECSPEYGNVNGYTPLHSAASSGHLAIVKYLISELGCNPQVAENHGNTPLHYACINGHLDNTKYLISDCNCNPQCSTNIGNTPLHCASEKGHLEVAKYLITEHKCSPEHGNVNGYTPLHSAASRGHLAVVKYLISELGCNPQMTDNNGLTPLHYACQKGHLEIAKYLITEHKCNPEHGNVNGYTPLHSASSNGHLAVVKYLITQHSCNPQCCDFYCYTPLHVACLKGHLCVVKYLVHEQNCAHEPEAKLPARMIKEQFLHQIFMDTDGITPLHLACMEGHLETVKHLIDACNCRPTHSTNNGFTAIDFAHLIGHQEVVTYLLNEHHCSLNLDQVFTTMRSKMSYTIFGSNLWPDEDFSHINFIDYYLPQLHRACISGNLEAVKTCITKSKCNASLEFLGLLPIHIACMWGHLEITKYLVTECKCEPYCETTPTYQNFTALATWFGQLEVVRWLVSVQKCKAEYNDKNIVPLIHIACMSGQLNIMKYLMSECSSQDMPDLLILACVSGHLNIAKYLIDECECDPHSTDDCGVTVLHLACIGMQNFFEGKKHHHIFEPKMSAPSELSKLQLVWRTIIFPLILLSRILNKFAPNPYITVSSESPPAAHYCRYRDVVKYLINEHNCNPQCRDKEGQTPLHYACANGQLEIVQYFHSEKLSDLVHTAHSGDTPLHYACKYNQVEVVQFLLSTGECDPLIKNTEGLSPVEIAASPEISALLDHFCKGKYPLESVVKVFVLGDPMAGKSSLVQAIQSNTSFLSSLIGRFLKVKGVRQQTAGIDSFTFSSSDFGNVVIYDFAGQREFHTSHAAFLQNSSSYVPGIFILVTNIADHEDNICQSLQYWVSFIQECCAHIHSKAKPCIIIIGSHADQLDRGAVEQALKIIGDCFPEHLGNLNHFFEIEGVICLDCTRPSSPGLDLLRHHLEESCNSIRESTEKIDQRCYVLHKYVHKEYINMGIHGSKLKNISKDLEDNPYLLPSTTTELLPLFQTLHDKGQVILLRNKHILDNSWIITNIPAILETVVGSIFAPCDFPRHIAPGTTGVIAKSKISGAFPDLNIDMVIGFLEHFEFCHQVGLDWIRIIQSKHKASDDEYYLFPALVTSENVPNHVLQERHEGNYCCGWCMHSTADHQFFTARFLHVLLLRLAFLFALPQDNAASEDETPALKRSCTMWKSGITWHDTNGVSTHFELRDLKTVILIMSSMKGSEIHCVRLRAQLINTILKAKKEFCPRVDVEECIMEVETFKALKKCPSQSTKCSLKYLSDRISTRDASDHQDLVLVNPDGSPGKRISELLYFEPYTLLTADLIKQMFLEENSDLLLKDTFISELAGRLYTYNNILVQILKPPSRVLIDRFKSDTNVLDSLDEFSNQSRCEHIFEVWMDQYASSATYRKLRQEFNKHSIFCGRNPLDLTGDKDVDSDFHQQYHYSSNESGESNAGKGGDSVERENENREDNSSQIDDQIDRPTLNECVRFRGRERRINIPQEIGIQFCDFGKFLLEDDTGARIPAIAFRHRDDAEQINREVLRQWINGRGKHPVTWKTLTVVLRDIELPVLAGEIEAVKCFECTEENIPSDDPVQKCPEDMPPEDSEQKNHRGMHDLPARDQSSSAPHGVSEKPPVQKSLRDIITEMTNSSEEKNIGNDIDDEKYYEAVRQMADIACRCVQQLQKNQKTS